MRLNTAFWVQVDEHIRPRIGQQYKNKYQYNDAIDYETKVYLSYGPYIYTFPVVTVSLVGGKHY